ncbi:MAG TPA: phosphoribosyltransferase [Gemmatimonadaceae bacterium]|nr:phosphoribosyltransferase [Gemmatimonadaceae bacterium]
MWTTLFNDRRDAGERLGELLRPLGSSPGFVVVGLPRGGIPVAFEVASQIGAPLDVCVVRKLGVPGHEEVAMGAIATGGVQTLNATTIRGLHITPEAIRRTLDHERRELERRERTYRDGHPPVDVHGRTVILVDDGLATGASMTAAVTALRQRGPRAIVVAVPVASPSACAELRHVADGCVCILTPEPFEGVGRWYADFSETTDDEVRQLLAAARSRESADAAEGVEYMV